MFLLTILFLTHQFNTYELQGSYRQDIQVTAQADHLQGNEGEQLKNYTSKYKLVLCH